MPILQNIGLPMQMLLIIGNFWLDLNIDYL